MSARTSSCWFFANCSELPQQTAAQAYGPVTGNTTTQYRLSSLFTGTGRTAPSSQNPTAIAVTSGSVFVVENEDTSGGGKRLNLILKPDAQIEGLPAIKYFIYRGLLRSDFLDDTGATPALKPTSTPDSNLIASLRGPTRNGVNAMHTYPDGVLDGVTVSAATLLDKIFAVRGANFVRVKAGSTLGRFDGSAGFQYGFEILLDEPNFAPTLGVARKAVNLIDLAASAAAEAKEAQRYQVLNYLDPAAFYGMFYRPETIWYQARPNVTLSSVGAAQYTGAALGSDDLSFTNLDSKLLAKFATRSRVYLDIRHYQQFPIDVDATNGSDIRFSVNGTAAASATAAKDSYRTSGWPIKIIEQPPPDPAPPDPPVAPACHRFQAPTETTVRLVNWNSNQTFAFFTLSVALPKGSSISAFAYLYSGMWGKLLALRKPAHNAHDDEYPRFKLLEFAAAPNEAWCQDAGLMVPAVKEGTTYHPLATYIRLQYFGRDTATAAAELNDQMPEPLPADLSFPELGGCIEYQASLMSSADLTSLTKKVFFSLSRRQDYMAVRKAGALVRKGVAVDQYGEVAFCIRSAELLKVANYYGTSWSLPSPILAGSCSSQCSLVIPGHGLPEDATGKIYLSGVTAPPPTSGRTRRTPNWDALNAASGLSAEGVDFETVTLAIDSSRFPASPGLAGATGRMEVKVPTEFRKINVPIFMKPNPATPAAGTKLLELPEFESTDFAKESSVLVKKNNREFGSFYDYIASKSKYDILAAPALRLHVVETETGKNCLEVRVVNPWLIRDRALEGFEPFVTFAYSQNDKTKIAATAAGFLAGTPLSFSLVRQAVVPDDRPFLKCKVNLVGLKYVSNKVQIQPADTGVVCYSLDGVHYFSPEYADQFVAAGTGTKIWKAKIVPALTDFDPKIQTQLDTVLKEVAAVDRRLLLGEARDYIYEASADRLTAADRLTFEIAFRMPFFCERSKRRVENNRTGEWLYTTTDPLGNPLVNQPYLARFEQWLGRANSIRSLDSTLGELGRSGYRKTTEARSWDDVSFYGVHFSQSARWWPDAARRRSVWRKATPSDLTNWKALYPTLTAIPAYIVRTLNDENPLGTDKPQLGEERPHIPAEGKLRAFKVELKVDTATGRDDLRVLMEAGLISDKLMTRLKGCFLGKAKVEKDKVEITWKAGDKFPTAGYADKDIVLGNTTYKIASVTGDSALTLKTKYAGATSDVVFSIALEDPLPDDVFTFGPLKNTCRAVPSVSSGTASVENGKTAVTWKSGGKFLVGPYTGQIIVLGSKQYAIDTVTSDSALVLSKPYAGNTSASADFKMELNVVPIKLGDGSPSIALPLRPLVSAVSGKAKVENGKTQVTWKSGDKFFVDSHTGREISFGQTRYSISSVASDTSLVLSTPYRGTTSDAADFTMDMDVIPVDLGGTKVVTIFLGKDAEHYLCRNADAKSGTVTPYYFFHNLGNVAAQSSITVGFGTDLGQADWKRFKTYTQYNDQVPDFGGLSPSDLPDGDKWKPILDETVKQVADDGTDSDITKEEIVASIVNTRSDPVHSKHDAKQRNAALASFRAFQDVLWNSLVANPVYSVAYASTYLKDEYLVSALKRFQLQPDADSPNRNILTVYADVKGVGSVKVDNGGKGYAAPPTITFSGGGGADADAEARLAGDAVGSITVKDTGAGYTSAPVVAFDGDADVAAAATAALETEYFYDRRGVRFMNELEALLLTSVAYNGTPAQLDHVYHATYRPFRHSYPLPIRGAPPVPSSLLVFMAHALNTHDVRWLLEALDVATVYDDARKPYAGRHLNSNFYDPLWETPQPAENSRRQVLVKLLRTTETADHYHS